MSLTEIGKSGLKVSKQGLGCMGMSEFYGDTNDQESLELLQQALKLGVNFFDTADVYGFGHNEKLLGEFIKTVPDRNSLILATKCGIVRDEHDSQKRGVDNSYDYILACCETSLTRLQTNIDLYYLHRTINDKTVIEAAMSAMALLLEQGKIKAVGLSEVSADYIHYAHNYLLSITNNKHGISAVQTEYSLMSRGVESNQVLDTCNELDITFVAYSPISRGLLSGEIETIANLASDDFRRNLPRFSEENLAHNNRINLALKELAERKQCTIAQLALAWLMNKSPRIIPIPGTKQLKYLQQNTQAMAITLTPDEVELLDNLSADFAAKGGRYTEQAMQSYALTE